MGPIRKQLPSGQFQNVYDGVKVRAQPLPLRVPTSPQQQTIQQQTQVNDIHIPTIQSSPQSIITPPTSPAPEPNSPILTNLLHKNSSSNPPKIDASNATLETEVCSLDSHFSIPKTSPTYNKDLTKMHELINHIKPNI